MELRKYLIKNYKNLSYSKDIKTANIVIDTDLKNFLKKNGKLYLILKKRNKNMIFSFVKNTKAISKLRLLVYIIKVNNHIELGLNKEIK